MRATLGRVWPLAKCLSVAEADPEGAVGQRPFADHSLSYQGLKGDLASDPYVYHVSVGSVRVRQSS